MPFWCADEGKNREMGEMEEEEEGKKNERREETYWNMRENFSIVVWEQHPDLALKRWSYENFTTFLCENKGKNGKIETLEDEEDRKCRKKWRNRRRKRNNYTIEA